MIWDGSSKTRPNPNVYRAPDASDWGSLLQYLKELETLIGQNVQNVYQNIADETILTGQPITFQNDSIVLADKTNPEVIGLSLNDCTFNETCLYITTGQLILNNWKIITNSSKLVKGASYYLSMLDSGKLDTIAPTQIDDIVLLVGLAHDVNILELKIKVPVYL